MKLQETRKHQLLDFSGSRYAVIEALRTDADPERFVIAYRSKQALHDVIAAPCIIALGLSSRVKRLKQLPTLASPRPPLRDNSGLGSGAIVPVDRFIEGATA